MAIVTATQKEGEEGRERGEKVQHTAKTMEGACAPGDVQTGGARRSEERMRSFSACNFLSSFFLARASTPNFISADFSSSFWSFTSNSFGFGARRLPNTSNWNDFLSEVNPPGALWF